ncbi:4'-phosphopantetheinyl transferase superfamily protein [Tessaracoccus sp. OS52]|uniref:holo-ACP synthase n=1 Tax=Tessaracoccus sp. OS52 TaxID=2886691 RepID=UPI001D1061EA|nr:4'-phosphopantetheinyl transferase superfamily protein [Tessaracoccus sp. OS52]
MRLRGVGVDIVEVRRIEQLLGAGGSFARRWFTADEATRCRAAEQPAQEFAKVLAAKEAAWKSLGISWDAGVPWGSLVLIDGGEGTDGCTVELTGEVARVASVDGLSGIRVTTTAIDELALAMAFAWAG